MKHKSNIELRTYKYHNKDEEYQQIVCWYDNERYGQDYSMYPIENGMVTVADGYRVSESLFKVDRLCYAVAKVSGNTIEMVGDRYLELNEVDRKDFDAIRRDIVEKE